MSGHTPGITMQYRLVEAFAERDRLLAVNAELVGVLEQAAMELEEAANILSETGFAGSGSIFRQAADTHRAAIAKSKEQAQ